MWNLKKIIDYMTKKFTSVYHFVIRILYKLARLLVYALIYVLGICICAIAISAALYIGTNISELNITIPSKIVALLLIALAIISGYVTFGFVLLLLLIIINKILPGSKWEGVRKVDDWRNISFFLSEASLILAEHLFLPLIRGTPLLSLFYRGMGAKIGKGTIIASMRVNDWGILNIGENCIIGGDCVLNGHSGERGNIIRKQIHIGDRVTIGQYATILPGVILEDDVVVGANSLVPKNTTLQSGRTYGGVPVVELVTKQDTTIKERSDTLKNQIELIDSQKTLKISAQENFQLLLESYKLRFSEILAIESFFSSVSVGSLSAMAGLFVYSVISNKTEMIAFLPILTALSGMVLFSLISGMNDLGFHMAKLEVLLQLRGADSFNWEATEGAIASSRNEKLPGIIVTCVYIVIFFTSVYLTFWGPLLKSNMIFLGFSLRTVAAVADIFSGTACTISYIYTTIQNRLLKRKLQMYRNSLVIMK